MFWADAVCGEVQVKGGGGLPRTLAGGNPRNSPGSAGRDDRAIDKKKSEVLYFALQAISRP